jgi:hypothetical protein
MVIRNARKRSRNHEIFVRKKGFFLTPNRPIIQRLIMRENKHSQQRNQEAALWGRNETLNLMQLGAIAIGSVLLAI